MTRSQEATMLAQDLESLGDGSLAEQEFRAKYDSSANTVAAIVWPYVEHFLVDADIRAGDDDYRTMQESELAKLVALLRASKSDSELLRITFLGYSPKSTAT